MTPECYSFARQGRSARIATVIIAVYAALVSLIILFDAALWLVALLVLPTLPALIDYWTDPSAGVELDETRLCWHSGRRTGELDLKEIDYLRLDTRWDFSIRATVVLTNGKKVRLPWESLPPHQEFEQALQNAGLRVERQHFRVF